MRRIVACLLALVTVGCGSTWTGLDSDGDGFTLAEGDCDDGPSGGGISPEAQEVWYDGVDQNCDGNDGDQDGDGEPALAVGGTDCWDDPTTTPADFVALNGFAQPEAADVLPGADDVWYDGVDQDCDGADDFDQDEDGFASMAWAETRTTLPVEDCFDALEEVYPESWPECVVEANRVITTPLSPAAIYPGADDTFYDGTDANCDGADDFDKDGDTFANCAECDDDDVTVFPNDAVEIWYNHIDENCDGNDADQDGDGYILAGYAEADPGDPIHVEGAYGIDDCWDDPAAIPANYDAINGEPQPEAADVHPDADESWYDGVDENCAGDNDFDQDGDGDATEDVAGRSGLFGEDCDDTDGTINSDAAETWYDGVDQDCSGDSDYDQDHDGYDSADYTYGTKDDCDDEKSEVHPSKSWDPVNEDCATTYDDDCDGNTNDDDADSCIDFYDDSDLDGYGELADTRCLCIAEATYTETGVTSANDDCDDTRATVNPAVTNESCSTSYDDDCDGVTNEQNGTACTTYYLDSDGDGYGTTTSQCWCAATGDYDVTVNTDCDDSKSAVNPGVTKESCATTYDDDCDGNTNEQNATSCTTYYFDDDGDAYGDATKSQCWCAAVGSYDVTNKTDCDDADADTFPGAAPSDSATACETDADGDNYGSTTAPSGGTAGTDCDDSKSGVKPSATETCGTTYDDDCDGSTNDVGATACTTYYYDGDSDTYGKSSLSQCTCTTSGSYNVTNSTDCDDGDADTFPGAAPSDSATACENDDDGDDYGDKTVSSGVTAGTDCDDTKSAVKPSATETCATTYDDDCDSSANDVGATGCTTYYYDADVDGYGTTTSQCTCSATGYYTASVNTDCDDTRSGVYPGRTELCTTTYDDDCDSSTNDVGATGCTTYYYDADVDGYGITTAYQCTCTGTGYYTVSGVTTSNDDCDDTLAAVNPGATETCATTYDDDCDGSSNDVGATACTTYYYDADVDGYGLTTPSQCTCSGTGYYTVTGVTTANDDCDDTKAAVNPAATETCATTYDDDCDGSANDVGATGCTTYYTDADSDGYGSTTSQCTCSSTGTYTSTVSTDCKDSDANTFPGAAPLDSPTACETDADADNYGSTTAPSGGTAGTDCDDSKSGVYVGHAELCSTTYDDDCDGSTNDVGATSCTTYYYDGDVDGYGTTTSQCTCTTTGYYTSTVSTDCDGSDADTFPGAAPSDSATACENDDDGDDYGDTTAPSGGTAGTDCSDGNSAIHPGAADTFATNDGIDNDCDNYIDETGVAYGDLVLTEFFGGNTTYTYDWFELYNNSGDTLSLANWTMAICAETDTAINAPYVSTDCTSWVTVTFPSSATVADDTYYVVCGATAAFTTAADCDIVITSYDSPAYTTSTDAENAVGGVNISLAGDVIDEVYWWQDNGQDDWPADASTAVNAQLTSIQLDLDVITGISPDPADANDDYSTSTANPWADDIWCTSEDAGITNDWAATFTIVGTPGTANVVCP